MLFYSSKMFVAFRREFNIKSSFLERKKKQINFCRSFASLPLSLTHLLEMWVSNGKTRLLSPFIRFIFFIIFDRSLDDVTEKFLLLFAADFRRFMFHIFFHPLSLSHLTLFTLFIQVHSLLYHHPISESIKMSTKTKIYDNIRTIS